MSNLWDNFRAWLAQPFSVDMDAFHWFLMFGLVIAIAVLWSFILRHVIKGIDEL